MEHLPGDLFHHIVRNRIFPFCNARQVQRLRIVSRRWNQVYLEAIDPANAENNIDRDQPSRGGSVPIGFLFETDTLQKRASIGLDNHDNFPSLNEAFGVNRAPKVVASSSGIFCISLMQPAQLLIWNPVVDESIDVPLPDGVAVTLVGLHVEVIDGVGVSPRCTVVLPYHNHDQDGLVFFFGGWAGVRIWNSVEQIWVDLPLAGLFEGAYDPGSVVTLGRSIFFHVSNQSIFYSHLIDGPGLPAITGVDNGPWELDTSFLCVSRGMLAACYLDTQEGNIRIYTRPDLWYLTDTIPLVPIIENFRVDFRSSPYILRNREPEPAEEALADASVVGYYDGWLFLRQRNGIVRISLAQNSARRLYLGRAAHGQFSVFFCCSSFLRLIPDE